MRRARLFVAVLALGVLTTVAAAWSCAVFVPVNGLARTPAARMRSAAGAEGEGYITVVRWDNTGSAFFDVYVAPADQQPSKEEWGERKPDHLVPSSLKRAAIPWTTGEAPWPAKDDNDVRAIDARGWPLLCLWSEYRTATDDKFQVIAVPRGAITIPRNRVNKGGWMKPYDLTLPFRPIWIGFAGNTVLFSGAWGVLFLAPFLLRASSRRRRGLCVECGYDMSGVNECPECGKTV